LKNYVMALLATAAVGAFASTAQAGVVLSDDFTTTDSAKQVPMANWQGDSVFTSMPDPSVPGSSSVDLVGSANGTPYFPSLAPSMTLNAVDLDGSEGTAFSPSGDLVSNVSLSTGTYDVSFLLAGNMRGAPTQTTTIWLGSQFFTESLPSGQGYTLFSHEFTDASGFLSFVESGPASQQGSLLTNVSVSTVPEASTWAMMMLGFAGLGFAAYRKARPVVSVG
jgi:PEP-CTERM motif